MKNFTLNCKGKLLTINMPVVMGILNVTPDSFFDGGKYENDKAVLLQAEKMLKEGAGMIDIGAMSSRPGAEEISTDEELRRLIGPLKNIRSQFPEAIISVDIFRSKVAEEAIGHGASIINDISGGQADEKIFAVAAKYHCPIIVMHRAGNFQTMHRAANYPDLLTNIIDYFNVRIAKAREYGVKDIIIDPGFGFSKTMEQNYSLLNNLKVLQLLDKPVLAGLSRKSMLYKPLGFGPEDALGATTAAHAIALQNGANILRVHDVKEAVECVRLHDVV